MGDFDDNDERQNKVREAFDNELTHIRLFILKSLQKKIKAGRAPETWCVELHNIEKSEYKKRDADDEIFTDAGMQRWASARGSSDRDESRSDDEDEKKSGDGGLKASKESSSSDDGASEDVDDGVASKKDSDAPAKKGSKAKRGTSPKARSPKANAKRNASGASGASDDAKQKKRESDKKSTFRRQVRKDCKDVKALLKETNLKFACPKMDERIDYKLIKKEVETANKSFKHRAALNKIKISSNTTKVKKRFLSEYITALEQTEDFLTLDQPTDYIGPLCNVNVQFAHDECLALLDGIMENENEEKEVILKADPQMLTRFNFLKEYIHYTFATQLEADTTQITRIKCDTKEDIKKIHFLQSYNDLYIAQRQLIKGFASTNEKNKNNAEQLYQANKAAVGEFIKNQKPRRQKANAGDDGSS